VVDAPNVSGQGTFITAINANGEVTGYYNDATTFTIRGLVRDQGGNFTIFDAPGAGINLGSGTYPFEVNLSGEVAGKYVDDNFINHSFVRDSSGNITDFDAPGARDTYAVSLNDSGIILGQWTNSGFSYSGFLRDSSGNITEFSAPVSNTGTYPDSINNSGRMTGYYYDLNGAVHGFVQ